MLQDIQHFFVGALYKYNIACMTQGDAEEEKKLVPGDTAAVIALHNFLLSLD